MSDFVHEDHKEQFDRAVELLRKSARKQNKVRSPRSRAVAENYDTIPGYYEVCGYTLVEMAEILGIDI